MARRLKEGVLKGFCKYSESTEVPSIFSLWVGISTIGSILGRDCFIDQGYFTIYPNMYIVLTAGSAKCRKSTAIGMGRRLLEKVRPQVKILSQKMTPEALIGSLSGMTATDDNRIIDKADGSFIVDELSTLLDKNAFKSGMVPLLTKLYDCEDFPYETRGRGVELIKNPCLSVLGGSTIHWIKASVPVESIGGGFTSRVVFVYRDQHERLIPWPTMSPEMEKLKDDIVHDLNEIAKMRGSFALTEEAMQIYSDEYKRFINESDMFNIGNLTGYAGRRHVNLLKASMAISASQRDSRMIDASDIIVAIKALETSEVDMPKVLQAISSEFVGAVMDEVTTFIARNKVVSRPDLVKAMRHKLSVRALDEVLDTLRESGHIATRADKGVVMYFARKAKR